LTDLILLYATIKKAQESAVENSVEKSIDWLANQFGNDADEVKKIYFSEYVR
jgi:hypothetical protein